MVSNETIPTYQFNADILASGVDSLKGEISKLVNNHPSTLIFDMQNVNVIDSSGIGLIISAYNQLQKTNGTIQLINVSSNILNMLKVMRLDKHFHIEGAN